MEKLKCNYYIASKLYKKFAALCKQQHRSASAQIVVLIEKFVEQEEQEQRKAVSVSRSR